jgi:hypothetical protein
LFVGAEAYEAAGGIILRDLFEHDDGGWVQDPALLNRLVGEKLAIKAERVRAEGWKCPTAVARSPRPQNGGPCPFPVIDTYCRRLPRSADTAANRVYHPGDDAVFRRKL